MYVKRGLGTFVSLAQKTMAAYGLRRLPDRLRSACCVRASGTASLASD